MLTENMPVLNPQTNYKCFCNTKSDFHNKMLHYDRQVCEIFDFYPGTHDPETSKTTGLESSAEEHLICGSNNTVKGSSLE